MTATPTVRSQETAEKRPYRLGEHHVAGRDVPAAGGRELRRIDPATGAEAAVVVPATAEEVAAAVAAAEEARAGWRRTPPGERA
ncbi:aldehyde dehydrogenase family protein, partial [Georgenia thermotolerans]